MVIVELKQANYKATIEAIAQAVMASLRPGAATGTLLAVAVEMSTKLTTDIEDFGSLPTTLLAVWDRLEAATSGEDAARLVNLTLEDVRQTVAAMIKRTASVAGFGRSNSFGRWGIKPFRGYGSVRAFGSESCLLPCPKSRNSMCAATGQAT
jgi:hypothetical protein